MFFATFLDPRYKGKFFNFSNFSTSITNVTTNIVIDVLKESNEKLKLQHADEAEQTLTNASRSNKSNINCINAVDLGVSNECKEAKDPSFDYNSCFDEIIQQKYVAESAITQDKKRLTCGSSKNSKTKKLLQKATLIFYK